MKQILFILSIITILGCSKEEPEPTPPKPNEADTMRALINGEEWSAYCGSSIPGLGCTKVNCQYYDDTKGISIGAGGKTHGISFSKNSGGGGELGTNILPYRRVVVRCAPKYCKGSTCLQYELDTTYLNVLEILEINIEYKIIEGKFEFRAVNQECADTILVTDGYFRANYRP